MFYNKAKKTALERLKSAGINYKIYAQKANDRTIHLYTVRKSAVKAIDRVEDYINQLANSPKEFKKEIAETKINIKEFKEAINIEEKNNANNIKGASTAGTGIVLGGAVASLGPTAAMAIATTFGTASTGTAIASLSGAAATNAALAWLGGGALAAGGSGMAGGSAFLALAGPVGWAIAGTLTIAGGSFASIKNKSAANQANEEAIKIEKEIVRIKIAIDKLYKYTYETSSLKQALDLSLIINTFPKNYLLFDNNQKEILAALINNTCAMGQLINKRIS